MKITDPVLIAAIQNEKNWAEIEDGLFAIAGQRYLIDVAMHFDPENKELPECVWVANTGEVPENKDGIYNASESSWSSLWDRCSANREMHFFTTNESLMAFFTEFVTKHNHLS